MVVVSLLLAVEASLLTMGASCESPESALEVAVELVSDTRVGVPQSAAKFTTRAYPPFKKMEMETNILHINMKTQWPVGARDVLIQ
jgi:hypothetical protein